MPTIRRINPAKKMARFYVLRLQGDLLAGWSVVREWGRIGRAGRVRVDPHAQLEIAETAVWNIEARKRRRGYS
jgi:predicted DNA-binding WGR domain protein